MKNTTCKHLIGAIIIIVIIYALFEGSTTSFKFREGADAATTSQLPSWCPPSADAAGAADTNGKCRSSLATPMVLKPSWPSWCTSTVLCSAQTNYVDCAEANGGVCEWTGPVPPPSD